MSRTAQRQLLIPTDLLGPTLLAIALASCVQTPQERAPSPQIVSLLVSETDFPPGWSQTRDGPFYPSSDAPLGGGPNTLDEVVLDFVRPIDGGSAGAFEEILRFWTEGAAADYYPSYEAQFFNDRPDEPWIVPTDLASWQSRAAPWRLGCTQAAIPSCHYVAQYGEYLVAFSAHTSAYSQDLQLTPALSMHDVESLLNAIDDLMSSVPGA